MTSRLIRATLLLLLCLASLPAQAQTVVPGGSSVTFNKCPAGSFLDGSFTNGIANCVAAPAGTGGGCAFVPSLEPVGRPIVAGDLCKLLIYTGAGPGTFTWAASSPTVLCIKSAGGQVILAPAASFYGGPVKLNKPDDECVSSDGAGKWVLWTGVGSAVANPNPFQ